MGRKDPLRIIHFKDWTIYIEEIESYGSKGTIRGRIDYCGISQDFNFEIKSDGDIMQEFKEKLVKRMVDLKKEYDNQVKWANLRGALTDFEINESDVIYPNL